MELKVKNYMEELVRNKMKPVLKTMPGICTCQMCELDIFAMALNNLPPKYVVTRKGEIFAKLTIMQNQFDVDILSAITNAAAIVSKNPRHGDKEFEA